MTAVMRPQSFTQQYQHQYSPRTRPSILINTAVASGSGTSIAQKRISNSNTPSNQSLSSSLDESSSSSSSSNSKSKATGTVSASSSLPSRRIRFAPLPDPALLEGEDGDGDASEDPHPHAASLGLSPAPPELLLPSAASSYYSPSGSAANSRQNSPLSQCRPLDADYSVSQNESTATLPDPLRAPDGGSGKFNANGNGLTPTPSHTSSATITSGWKPKLLKPFMRRAPSPNPKTRAAAPPTASRFNLSSISAEDVLTLGAINLFRSGSRESRSGASTTSSEEDGRAGTGMLSLGRWTSAGSAGGKGKGKEWFGSPLARSESAHSFKGDERRSGGRARASSVTSNSSSKSAGAVLGGAKGPGGARAKGTRMLNGRVYGGRRALKESNLFETAKDEEPAFVEWGYGGMGAVKSKGAHPDKDGVEAAYSKVHGGTGLTTKGGDDDDDDGGGVSWARKRREAREKAAKEKAAAEAAAAAAPAEAPAAAESAPTPAETANETEGAAAVELVAEPAEMTAEEAPKPLVHAFPGATVAAASPISPTSPVRPHHRTRSGSGSASLISLPSAPPPEERERGPRSPLRLASFEYKAQAPAAALAGAKGGSGSGSGTTSEDEGESESDGASSEDEDAATVRKTALGAGVEKVSRHKDAEEAHAPPAHPHALHE